ncbi:hypothetical protein TK35_08555 [Lacticaseibacillus paracasei]|nr:hypothetical protein TK35_08555 [Lacticaseibacillus paracasei]TEA91138.1 hypothetical protein TK36_08630 [Lacticaseibacillus paracasei]
MENSSAVIIPSSNNCLYFRISSTGLEDDVSVFGFADVRDDDSLWSSLSSLLITSIFTWKDISLW